MPFVSTRSLCAIGSPCSKPTSAARAKRSSAARAPSIARSGRSVTIALTFGLTRSICLRCASITSRAETSLLRMSRASSVAVKKQSLALFIARALAG